MGRWAWCLVALTALSAVAAPALVAAQRMGETASVHIGDDFIDPLTVTVRTGATVQFENVGQEPHWVASDVHPRHTNLPGLDAGRPLAAGARWSYVFTQIGRWGWHDHLNPHLTGTVIVVPTDNGPTEPSSLWQRLSAWWQTWRPRWPVRQHLLPDRDETACGVDNFVCWSQALRHLTARSGPEAAVKRLSEWRADGTIAPVVDEHQLAHQIGRETAATFGKEAAAFLRCPMSDFNGGCQHGFFEHVLGEAATPAAAAESICASLDEASFAHKYRYYCYHGVGHGLLMAHAYDLDAALKVCNALDALLKQDGCWQGVFMENANAGAQGIARVGMFSVADPLAPCRTITEAYRWQCYLNHGGYLVHVLQGSFPRAVEACLTEPNPRWRSACVQSLGLLISNPVWQHVVANSAEPADTVSVALTACEQAPPTARQDCLIGALDNIMNFDELNLAPRAIPFCERGRRWPKDTCFAQIGVNVGRLVTSRSDAIRHCAQVPETDQRACLAGARR